MARILVADDNSNVQKTVTLALAGLGMDVVSVSNGEAAVRKLSDFSPDLVLADIFMPVRNGYEVCEFVKKDSRFSGVPVVLLVGAFDPLDEREAQRVGADGILKKPFVPPDPLITMVKTLLDKTASERLVAVSASKSSAAAKGKVGGFAIAEVRPPTPETSDESLSPEFPSPIARVAFGEGDHPIAFGTLLETAPQDLAASSTAALEPVDDAHILTSSRDATLGDPIFWRNNSDEAAPQPEPVLLPEPERSPELVQSEEVSPGSSVPVWKQEEVSPPGPDDAILMPPIEPLELVRDEQEEGLPSVVDPESILQDPARLAPLTVAPHKAEDLAENPLEWMATAPPALSEEPVEAALESSEPVPDAADTIDPVKSSEHIPVPAQVSAEAPARVPVTVVTRADAPIADKPPAPAATEPTAFVSPTNKIATNPSSQSPADTARSVPKQDWADLTASVQASATELAASPDPALVEAVVQRVLDKMRPQIVDLITKEFLRPIVQALVHREIDKH